MGMPRYLKDKYESYFSKDSIFNKKKKSDMVEMGWIISSFFSKIVREKVRYERYKEDGEELPELSGKWYLEYDFGNMPSQDQMFKLFYKKAFKCLHGYSEDNFYDYSKEYEKVEIEWFTGWEKDNSEWKWICVILMVNKYFAEQARLLSDAKKNLEFEKIFAHEEIKKIKNKIYGSRNFPKKLKNILFERDNFTCQICHKHKDFLEKNNWLEVDHIVEYEDGGDTCYDNGQTVCADCNKGKHHAKKHNLKLAELKKQL